MKKRVQTWNLHSLNRLRLKRVAKRMEISLLEDWLAQYEQYQAVKDVRENSATGMRF